jgi:hypothetical protein
MTARAARRPRAVRCPGCEKPLNDGQPLDHVTGDVGGYVETSPGHFRKSHREGKIGWHTSCLADFRAQNERSAADALLSQDISMVACFPDNPAVVVKAMRNNGRTEDHITAVLAAVAEGRTY